MKQPTNEQIARAVKGVKNLAAIARKLADTFTELAETAEDLVALWDDELDTDS
jgi:hypothetical protein